MSAHLTTQTPLLLAGAAAGLLCLTTVAMAQPVKEEYRVPALVAHHPLAFGADDGYAALDTGPTLDFWAARYDRLGNQLWKANYPESRNETQEWIAIDSEGNVIVTGSAPYGVPDPSGGMLTVKFQASDGAILWARKISVDFTEGRRVAVDAADNIYVVGENFANDLTRQNYLTAKYDPAGNLLWMRHMAWPGNSQDIPKTMAVSPEGRVVVSGYVSNDFGTVVYDTDGNKLWDATYPSQGQAYNVRFGSDNQVYLCGLAVGLKGLVVGYSAGGNLLFATQVASPNGNYILFRRMALDQDGNIIAVGWGDGLNFLDWMTAKLDPQGNLLWVTGHDGYDAYNESAYAVTAGPEGEIYVVGLSGQENCNGWPLRQIGAVAIRYDSAGAVDWIHEAVCAHGQPHSVALNSAGRVVFDSGMHSEVIQLVQRDWIGLGHALAGAMGFPQLDVSGYLDPSATINVNLTNALPSALGWHVIGLSRIDAPFRGGLLVPNNDVLIGIMTDTAGRSLLAVQMPPNPITTPFKLYLQTWLRDPAGFQGFSASNAVHQEN